MAVSQQNVMDLRRQDKILGVSGILRDEWIDQNVCALGGLTSTVACPSQVIRVPSMNSSILLVRSGMLRLTA